MKTKYILSSEKGITYRYKKQEIYICNKDIRKALHKANQKIYHIDKLEPEIFSLLGMRNLSAFLGEIFASSLASVSDGKFIKNPHQDGYPDLLAMTELGKTSYENLKNNLQDKKPFSPFLTGGIEIKATCGSVPTPAVFSKLGLKKPNLGDSRIYSITGYEWKAHHRETNNLIGLVWDFIENKPIIVGIFYSAILKEEDWGNIVKPKEGGGRTTSVSIMTRSGVGKMYKGWLAIIDDPLYIKFFNKYNKSSLIAR